MGGLWHCETRGNNSAKATEDKTMGFIHGYRNFKRREPQPTRPSNKNIWPSGTRVYEGLQSALSAIV